MTPNRSSEIGSCSKEAARANRSAAQIERPPSLRSRRLQAAAATAAAAAAAPARGVRAVPASEQLHPLAHLQRLPQVLYVDVLVLGRVAGPACKGQGQRAAAGAPCVLIDCRKALRNPGVAIDSPLFGWMMKYAHCLTAS